MQCKASGLTEVLVGPTPAADSNEDRDKLEHRREWGKVDYFEQYIDENIFEHICDSTNRRSVKYTGKSLNCSIAEIKNFFGIALLTGCLNFPQIRMYWSGVTRVPHISTAMPRDRFFKIRSNLKVVDDDAVSTSSKEADRLWKAMEGKASSRFFFKISALYKSFTYLLTYLSQSSQRR